MFIGIHHVAIICSNYQISKDFYTRILGLTIVAETFREERQSYKLDLSINGEYCLELFSFPPPLPKRPSRPEGLGLRHIAFSVMDIDAEIIRLLQFGVSCEPLRIDQLTGKLFTFFADPDDLPIELYQY